MNNDVATFLFVLVGGCLILAFLAVASFVWLSSFEVVGPREKAQLLSPPMPHHQRNRRRHPSQDETDQLTVADMDSFLLGGPDIR